MTNIKILSAVVLLSTAIAAPVFAQDGGVLGPGSRNGLTPQPGATHHLRGHHRNGFAHFNKGMHRSSMASMSRPGGRPISRKPSGS